MPATLPFANNRIATHLPTPEPELPKSARDRGKLWSDTVFQAVLALKAQLRSPDAQVVMAAANAILGMERTRMRHAKNLAGSEHISDSQEEYEEEQDRRFDYSPPPDRVEKPAPERAAPSAALAAHACEVRTASEAAGAPMSERQALRFTADVLRRMELDAEDVPLGTLAATMRERRAMWEPVRTAV